MAFQVFTEAGLVNLNTAFLSWGGSSRLSINAALVPEMASRYLANVFWRVDGSVELRVADPQSEPSSGGGDNLSSAWKQPELLQSK